MITRNLRVNQLSAPAFEWYLNYLGAMDRLDIEAYLRFLADDCDLQFNNGPAIKGKPAIRNMLNGYWKSFASIEHDLLNIYGVDDSFALEADNHYKRHDGRSVTVSAVACTDRNRDGRATSVRIYADASPLFVN